jgi:hypothetical protein
MTLPKALAAKRDELLKKGSRQLGSFTHGERMAGIYMFDACYADLQPIVEALRKCDDQMQYYSCEIRDNPSSWNEVMDLARQALQPLEEKE